MSQIKTWKVIDLLKTTAGFFKQKNIENPRLNAEVLLAFTLKCDRIRLYLDFERPLKEQELTEYRSLVARRSKYEPLQYITGETEFMGLIFKVNTDVLIPRPETEVLVEEILKIKPALPEPVSVLDIGTGSGCIAISVAHFWPEVQVTAIDINPKCLKTAEGNAALNKTGNVTFIEQDIFKMKESTVLNEDYDIIISNPPYISLNEIETLQSEVKDYEPREALTDFDDGLLFYRHIMDSVQNELLKARYLFFEMSGLHQEKIVAEAKKRNFKNVKSKKDLTGLDRVLKIEI
jgi:release factor glutamine methyltransferase